MPNPGTANNPAGINLFSGPLGQKEPAYGAVERMKLLTSLAPVGSPAAQNAPQRAKRAAQRGRTAAPKASGSPQVAPPPATAQNADPYQMALVGFWQQVAADPNASDLVKGYASEVAR